MPAPVKISVPGKKATTKPSLPATAATYKPTADSPNAGVKPAASPTEADTWTDLDLELFGPNEGPPLPLFGPLLPPRPPPPPPGPTIPTVMALFDNPARTAAMQNGKNPPGRKPKGTMKRKAAAADPTTTTTTTTTAASPAAVVEAATADDAVARASKRLKTAVGAAAAPPPPPPAAPPGPQLCLGPAVYASLLGSHQEELAALRKENEAQAAEIARLRARLAVGRAVRRVPGVEKGTQTEGEGAE
ncbi:hypothetical protein MBLNU230_g4889t1 [Neophaeotheca triangularis]